MKKSISIWAFENGDNRTAEDIFKQAKRAGFEGIELAVGDAGLLTLKTTKKDCEALLATAADIGIEICSVASGLGWGSPMTSDDPKVRSAGVQAYRKVLQITSWLGVGACLVIPGRVYAGFIGDTGQRHVPYDVACKRAADAVKKLLPTAQKCKVVLGIENVWNMMLLSPLEMKGFIDQFKSKWVGCYFDVGNVLISGFAEDWIGILGKRIARVHFKDFKRSVGTLEGFCDLLDGDCNYPAVMAALKKAGYKGPCTVEDFNHDYKWMAKTSKRMDKILKMA